MGLNANQTVPGQQGKLLAQGGVRGRVWDEGMEQGEHGGKTGLCQESSEVRKVGWDRQNLQRLDT